MTARRPERSGRPRTAAALAALAGLVALFGCTGDTPGPNPDPPAATQTAGSGQPVALADGSVTTTKATDQDCQAYIESFDASWQRQPSIDAGSGTLTSLTSGSFRVDVQCAFGTMTVTTSRLTPEP